MVYLYFGIPILLAGATLSLPRAPSVGPTGHGGVTWKDDQLFDNVSIFLSFEISAIELRAHHILSEYFHLINYLILEHHFIIPLLVFSDIRYETLYWIDFLKEGGVFFIISMLSLCSLIKNLHFVGKPGLRILIRACIRHETTTVQYLQDCSLLFLPLLIPSHFAFPSTSRSSWFSSQSLSLPCGPKHGGAHMTVTWSY